MTSRKFSIDDQKIPFSDFQIEHLYCEEGLSLREIAQRFGVTHQAVHDRMLRIGVPLRSKAPRPQPIPIDKKTLRRLYKTERLSAREIGERLGEPQTRVVRWLKAYKIEMRTPGNHRRKYILGDLRVGESAVLPRTGRPDYSHNFLAMARKIGIRVKVETLDETSARVTRIA